MHVDLWAATQQLVRRLARTAGVGAWEQLSPHSLRHSVFAWTPAPPCATCGTTPATKIPGRPAGTTFPRQPDRNAAYTVAAYLA